MGEPAARRLELPVLRRLEPHASGERVEAAELDVPPVLIRLTAVEDGSFDDPWAMIDRGRHGQGRARRQGRLADGAAGRPSRARSAGPLLQRPAEGPRRPGPRPPLARLERRIDYRLFIWGSLGRRDAEEQLRLCPISAQ